MSPIITPRVERKWEIGQKRPSGTALKLLHLVRTRGLDIVST
jgi:putative transcriptional regulator